MALWAWLFSLTGCTSGIIFTHIVKPLDLNMDRTPVVSRTEAGDIKRFKVQGFYVDLQWDSNAIGEIAKQHGLETVYYADLEVLTVLGIWTQQTVHVYGR